MEKSINFLLPVMFKKLDGLRLKTVNRKEHFQRIFRIIQQQIAEVHAKNILYFAFYVSPDTD